MDQNQTSTPQPDYSFIVNQPGPNDVPPGQSPKKKSKKFIVLIILLVITVLTIGLAALLPSKKGANNGSSSTSSSTPTTSQAVVQAYIDKVKVLDLDGAYDLMNPQTRVSKKTFTDLMAPALAGAVQLDRCTVQKPQGDQVLVKCTESNSKTVSTVTFKMTNTKPPTIDHYGLTGVTK